MSTASTLIIAIVTLPTSSISHEQIQSSLSPNTFLSPTPPFSQIAHLLDPKKNKKFPFFLPHIHQSRLLFPSPMDAVDAAKKPFLLTRSLSYHHTFHRRARDSSLPIWKTLADDIPKLSTSNLRVVIYTTSLRSIRRTHADCCAVRAIFRGLRVAVDERDVSIHVAFRHELQALVGSKSRPVALPQVFVRGKHIGGVEEVMQLHEAGEMGRLLEGVIGQDPAFVCGGCGGVRFLPCGNCRGSRKVFVEEEGRMRRCENCNENGLVRCASCFPLSFN